METGAGILINPSCMWFS